MKPNDSLAGWQKIEFLFCHEIASSAFLEDTHVRIVPKSHATWHSILATPESISISASAKRNDFGLLYAINISARVPVYQDIDNATIKNASHCKCVVRAVDNMNRTFIFGSPDFPLDCTVDDIFASVGDFIGKSFVFSAEIPQKPLLQK